MSPGSQEVTALAAGQVETGKSIPPTASPREAVVLGSGEATLDLAGIERGEVAISSTLTGLGLHSAPSWKLAVKRGIDIFGSVVLLLVTLPVLVLTAIAVGVSTRGPIFYVQERVGRDGRHFRMVKFRSMYVDADERIGDVASLNQKSGPIFKLDNDPRVTKVGRVIRKLSVDELPQLVNVLKGDMSIVGPRPPLPREVVEYRPLDRQRLTVTPGLTCIWQVSGRSELEFDEWIQMDLEYIRDWSLGLDLRLMLRTIPAILTAKGAY